MFVIGAPILVLLLHIIAIGGEYFWLYCLLAIIGIMMLMMYLIPTVI